MESFREVLSWLEARGDLHRVKRAVDPKHELTAVMRQMQKGPNHGLIFTRVRGSAIPVATNAFGFRRAIAASVGLEEQHLLRTLVMNEGKRLPVERVTTGP